MSSSCKVKDKNGYFLGCTPAETFAMLVLASQSRYKRQQIEVFGLDVQCVSPDIDEALEPGEPPHKAAARLAEYKARAVARTHPDAAVIGSDQTAHLEGETDILRKPGNFTSAFDQLMRCSGRTVLFHSGLCLLRYGESPQTHVETTRVRFRDLDADTVRRYLVHDQPWDCVGAFKCEGLGIALFEQVTSNDPTALIGLPLIALSHMLRRAGYRVP